MKCWRETTDKKKKRKGKQEKELSQFIGIFCRGNKENRRRTHWLAWDKLMRPKGEAGMGFHDLRLFIHLLLANQVCWLLVYQHPLCAKVMKAKYYPHGHVLDTVFPQAMSVTWQNVMHGLKLL